MKNKVVETKIDKLIPDDLNANKGTEFGHHLMEKSFRELGAGRSILLDRNGKIIAGNKSTETAAAIGMEDVIIVETDGTKLVAVKRMDIDIDSKQGRELAIADNATAKANIAWDQEVLTQIAESWEVDQQDWGIQLPEPEEPEADPFADTGIAQKSQYGVIVICESEKEQESKFKELSDLGYKCKVVVV